MVLLNSAAITREYVARVKDMVAARFGSSTPTPAKKACCMFSRGVTAMGQIQIQVVTLTRRAISMAQRRTVETSRHAAVPADSILVAEECFGSIQVATTLCCTNSAVRMAKSRGDR